MTDARCHECDRPVSYETGFSMTGGLGDNSQDRMWCLDHAPSKGRGYTLSDLQQWREDNQTHRAQREMQMMDLMGPEVYFHVSEGVERKRRRQRYERAVASMAETLRRIGVIE